MFSPHQHSGFYRIPVTKGVLGTLVATSIMFNIPLHSYRPWFMYTYSSLFEKHDVLRFLICRLVFLDPKDLICASVMLYHFRIFERRYGSLKFASYMFGTFLLSCMFEVGALYLCKNIDISMDPMPSGPYGLVYSLFVPYFCDIPRVAITHILHIPVTGKSLTYILGLQMASGSLESAILALCGVLSGMVYKHNLCRIQSFLRLPSFVGSVFQKLVGALIESGPPPQYHKPMGATLELQRQEELERIEQQMLMAQIQRANGQARNFQGVGLFGNRGDQPFNQNPLLPNPIDGLVQNHEAGEGLAEEDKVQQLLDMGFTRDSVLQALQLTNNDVAMATNVLLQES